MFNTEAILQQTGKYDSFYLYDENRIVQSVESLKRDFPGIRFLYSLKTNPHPMVVKTVLSRGFGADAASLAEVKMAVLNDILPGDIHYSAPGKTQRDIEGAMGYATIIADSINEIELIQKIAAERNETAEIGIRVNPSFSFADSFEIPSKFGIDDTQVFEMLPIWKTYPNIRITGIHIHLRSQELDAVVLSRYYENIFNLAEKIQNELSEPLGFINMGSGLGIPYSEKDIPLDTQRLGRLTAELIAGSGAKFANTRIYIETGRYVAGKSGVYATKVLDKKMSFGKTFVILSNTLNGFLRPCIAQLVAHYAKNSNVEGSEPLFTAEDAFSFVPITDETEQETVTLVGNLCAATDVIAKDILLPKLKLGDMVVITNAGSYAAALSPMQFSSQVPPVQLFLTQNGKVLEDNAQKELL